MVIRMSKINLSLYITPEDLELLRDKKSRRDKNCKETIITRNLELVLQAQKGNTKARNYLFLLNTPFMRWKLNQWFHIQPNQFDEYISDCFFYFQDAVDLFDSTKSDNFLSFLGMVLKNNFINEHNFQKRRKLDIADHIDCSTDEEYDSKYFVDYDVKIFELQNDE